MSQSSTATARAGSSAPTIMLTSLGSLCSRAAACAGGRWASSQAATASRRGSSAALAACQRSVQPLSWRSTKPSGRPSSPRSAAAGSTLWRSASASTMVSPMRRARPGSPWKGGGGVDLVEIGERVDDGLADAPGEAGIALEGRRQVAADDDAVTPLHDVERRADHRLVHAQQVTARRQRIDPPQAGQHTVLARHVVGAGRDRPQGRPAQHVLGFPVAKQVGQVGVAAAELAELERPFRPRQLAPQITFEPLRIEPLVGPDRDQLGGSCPAAWCRSCG